MIRELEEYFDNPYPELVDWDSENWEQIRPILSWLGIAPSSNQRCEPCPLSDEVTNLLTLEIVKKFDAGKELTWSSKMLEDVFTLVEQAIGTVEPLLETLSELVENRPLTQNLYEFSRAVGNTLRCMQIDYPLNLNWIKDGFSESQCCFRYWIISLKIDLWDDVLESKTMDVLKNTGFVF